MRPAIEKARARITAAGLAAHRRGPAGPRLGLPAGRARAVRRSRGPVPRPGPDPAQAAALRRRREHHAGVALRPHLPRPRHRLRHRRHREGPRRQLPGRPGPGHRLDPHLHQRRFPPRAGAGGLAQPADPAGLDVGRVPPAPRACPTIFSRSLGECLPKSPWRICSQPRTGETDRPPRRSASPGTDCD